MTTNHFDPSQARDFVGAKWDAEIVPQLVEYIRIPNKSPMFDADWVKHGYMEQAVSLMETCARAQVSIRCRQRMAVATTTASCSTATWTSSRR